MSESPKTLNPAAKNHTKTQTNSNLRGQCFPIHSSLSPYFLHIKFLFQPLLRNVSINIHQYIVQIPYSMCACVYIHQGFSDSSFGKESACNAGDPSSIPGSRRSTGAGIGYPLQYSWASHVVQLVKNPPAMWETWVRSLDWEDPLEKGKAFHSSVLAQRIPWTLQSTASQRVRHN